MNVIVRCCGLPLVLAAAGCSLTPVAPATPTTVVSPASSAPVVAAVSPPTAALADYRDPATVCRRFTAALYSADTRRDRDPGAAWARAATDMDGALAAQAPAAARDGRWDTWRSHQARLSTTVRDDNDARPATDTPGSARRWARVTATPVGEHGWRGPAETSIVACRLTRTDSGWRVAAFEITPAGLP
ncbi:hypothetical protein [Actinoplanes sp. L3-i22]|uniref:hypothetical protein n=1 Tax=Actinoplanes sp. L3-i22 TaxID=2836373 RepID=UPI001C77907C|nr:hypothetical protein [Actinoplanes sp. L3-i22]BCY10973.1 hypothetical protein L3i22_060610 [Actinoplanes sp. L3-i22]